MITILHAFARIYQKSTRGRRGGTADYTIEYEKYLRLAGVSDGDEREIAERELKQAESESKGLFRIDRAKRSNLPERLRLSGDGGEAWLFRQIGETAPDSQRGDLSDWFRSIASSMTVDRWRQEWSDYFNQLADAAIAGNSIQPFRRDDPDGNLALTHALAGVLKWQGPTLIRYASSAICGDSKRLQILEPRLRVALHAITGQTSLEDFGILRKPRFVTFHGPLTLTHQDKTIDFSQLPAPVSVAETNFTPETRVSTTAGICLTVENEDTFHELAATNPGVLLILTSYAGAAVRHLMRRLPEEMEFRHFGDSDPAGFDILRDLREKTGRDIHALMVPGWFASPTRTQPVSDAETRILNRLLNAEMPEAVRPLLEKLLHEGKPSNFEQESVRVEDVWMAIYDSQVCPQRRICRLPHDLEPTCHPPGCSIKTIEDYS